jgi:hypothetical protein
MFHFLCSRMSSGHIGPGPGKPRRYQWIFTSKTLMHYLIMLVTTLYIKYMLFAHWTFCCTGKPRTDVYFIPAETFSHRPCSYLHFHVPLRQLCNIHKFVQCLISCLFHSSKTLMHYLIMLVTTLYIKYMLFAHWTFCCTGNETFIKVYQWFYWTSNPKFLPFNKCLNLWKTCPLFRPHQLFQ